MIVRFGEYDGDELENIPSYYLKWVAENFNDGKMQEEADRIWAEREELGEHISKEDYEYNKKFG